MEGELLYLWIDLFKLSLSDNIRSVQIKIYHKLCAAPYPLRGSNNHKLRRTSLKSLRILSCDPWKISSLFGTLGHKQSIITPPVNRSSAIFPVDVSRWCVSVTSARCVSLIGYFGHFKSKLFFFCWILSRCPACKLFKSIEASLYVGIFQFYCTWKTENCRIFWPNQRVVFKILRWAALAWLVEKSPRDLMQIWFPKFSESDLKRSIVLAQTLNRANYRRCVFTVQ